MTKTSDKNGWYNFTYYFNQKSIIKSLKSDIIIYSWYLYEVKNVIISDDNNFIDLINKNTVLKYLNLSSEESLNLNFKNEKVYRILR